MNSKKKRKQRKRQKDRAMERKHLGDRRITDNLIEKLKRARIV